MKIEGASGYGLYRTQQSPASPKSAAKAATGKTDVVEFSRGGASGIEKEFVSVKSAVLREAGTATEPSRLSALQESIRLGTYRVSTEEIVDAILGS